MLEAFGKGASEEIRHAKNTLYQAMTWDPESQKSLCMPLPAVPPPAGKLIVTLVRCTLQLGLHVLKPNSCTDSTGMLWHREISIMVL